MAKNVVKINENDLARIISEALNEIDYPADKWAAMAGAAAGSQKTGLAGMGKNNQNYNDRKQRQANLFAQMAKQGSSSTDIKDGNHNINAFTNTVNRDANMQKGETPFQIQQVQGDFGYGKSGSQNGQVYSKQDYLQNVARGENDLNNAYAPVADNTKLNNAFKGAYNRAKQGQTPYGYTPNGKPMNYTMNNVGSTNQKTSNTSNYEQAKMDARINEVVDKVISKYIK